MIPTQKEIQVLTATILYDVDTDEEQSTQMTIPHSADGVHIYGLVQKRRNPSASAMKLRLSCTNPSICGGVTQWYSKDQDPIL